MLFKLEETWYLIEVLPKSLYHSTKIKIENKNKK